MRKNPEKTSPRKHIPDRGSNPGPLRDKRACYHLLHNGGLKVKNFSFYFFFFAYLPSPNLGLTPPGTYKPNARESDACRESNNLWTRTLDRYTRAGLPECLVSTISGPPPKRTQDRIQTKDRTQTKDTHPIPGQKLKFLIPLGIEPEPPRRVGRQGLYRPRHGDGC